MLLYLTSPEPSNARYCTQDGEVLFKSECPYQTKKRVATIWRALPSLKPTPENTLWAERHFILPRPSSSLSSNSPQPVDGGAALDTHHIHTAEEEQDPDLHRHPSFDSHDHDFHWENPLPFFDDFQKAAVETEIQTDFTKVAEIEFHTISSTKIRYGEKVWTTSEFFKKEGWAWYGGNRLFTGPDGKEYKWKMGSSVSELFLEDTDLQDKEGKTHPRAHVPFLVARFCSPRDGPLHDNHSPPYLEIFPMGEHMIELILVTFIYIEEMRRQRQKLMPSDASLRKEIEAKGTPS